MTIEQIYAMPAGPDLDALVAEKVMGWTCFVWRGVPVWEWPGFRRDGWYPSMPKRKEQLPPYSTDIATAWLVFAALEAAVQKKHYPAVLCLKRDRKDWWVEIHREDFGYEQCFGGDTAPLAICRAALLIGLQDAPLTPPIFPTRRTPAGPAPPSPVATTRTTTTAQAHPRESPRVVPPA